MRAINNILAPAQIWLNGLEEREHRIVIAGILSLAIILFYLLIWDPVISRHEQQQLSYDNQRQTLSWMTNAAQEIQQISSAGGSSIARFRNQSISSLADRSATTTGIKPFIDKLEQSKQGVKVTFKSADFDRIVIWLTDLQNKYGIIATTVKVEKTKVKGSIDALITLERSS